MRGRKIFNGAGALQPDNTIWRAGANEATALHTDADLDIGGLAVPKGDYTLFVWLDPQQWKLVINKQTGQLGTGISPGAGPGPRAHDHEQTARSH